MNITFKIFIFNKYLNFTQYRLFTAFLNTSALMINSGADLLIYGMGEVPIMEIAKEIKRGVPLAKLRDIEGVCYLESFDKPQ